MAYVIGDNGSNFLPGSNSSNDIIFGYDGNDLLFGLGGNDWLFGHEGWDHLYGGSGDDALYGGSGNDVLSGGAGGDYLNGGSGFDTAEYLNSSAGVFVSLNAGQGWFGDAQGDTLVGIENLTGSQHDDILFGDDGANTIDGSAGDDLISGYGGDDTLIGGAGSDELNGGSGSDTASYVGSSSAVWVFLETGYGYFGDAQGDDLISIENLVGSDHNDRLYGDSQANTIYGGAGGDLIKGGGGNDTLIGGAGDDQIDGGSGNDTIADGAGYALLTGGTGADTFVFNTSEAYPLPRNVGDNPEYCAYITDFSQADGDRIEIDGMNMTFIGDYNFSGNAGELRYQNASADMTWVEGDLNGDQIADFRVFVAGEHEMTASDFIL